MRKFEILFDHAEPSSLQHPAYSLYGPLGFPPPPPDRPWIYSNFVQTLDGIASWKGRFPRGSDISQSAEDRWLMDLLRAHADAVLLGVNTLLEERSAIAATGHTPTATEEKDRGAIYRIEDPALLDLRKHLGRGPERNIFVTGGATLELSNFAVFDGDQVESAIITTRAGAERLARDQSHPHVQVIVAGDDKFVDLPAAVRTLRQQMGIRYLLCEGGPTLYGYLSRAALVDEKFLTISPVEAGQIIPPDQELSTSVGPARLRPTTFNAPGFTKDDAPWWTWMSCRKVGDHQFNRYRRKR